VNGKDEIMKLHERFSTLSPIYSGGLTNHLPMVITALRLLDVDEAAIEKFSEEYVSSKNIVDLTSSGIENDPFNDEYVILTNTFMNEINQKSVEKVVATVLNENKYSLHSGLFHGIIRLAYAYLEGNDLLIAQALAYFVMIAQDLKLNGTPTESVQDSFEDLVEIRKRINIDVMGTTNKMTILLDNQDVIEKLFYPYNILKDKEAALRFFIDYYNKSQDFYMLHVITGYHALHILDQFLEEKEEAYNNFFMQAIIVMLIHPHTEYTNPKVELESFASLTKKVPQLTDSHDVKLFFTLAYFYERYQMDDLLISANLIFNS
jgi:hypothetical protein